MPYNGEKASKGGHADFVKNPDVMSFLAECEYMREPNSTEASLIASAYQKILLAAPPDLPRYVVASDASKSDTPINDKLPSTQIGFIKVSQVLIGMERYAELTDPASRFVDPFKAAEMHRNASAITFTLPGSNIRFQGAKSVKDGFRRAVFKQLNTNRAKDNSHFLLTETLLQLNNGVIEFSLCPSCGIENSFQFITNKVQHCSHCREPVFITDWLRLHEDISDFGNNTSAMTRMMNVIEHLLLVTLIHQVFSVSPKSLSTMAFVIDGPLAIFGQPAKLHSRIMEFLFGVNNRLAELNLDPILVIGLQKTGDVMDHANILNKFLPPGVIKLLDDEYRYKYIKGSDSPSENFGGETYYGQDFIFKTERGRVFNFAIPYPFPDKAPGKKEFSKKKAKIENYGNLVKKACSLICHFELDLYQNAIVPVALAHRHASISIVPGGKVLDIITKTGLKNN